VYTLEGVFCAEIYPKLNRARGMTEIGFVGSTLGVHFERSRDQFSGGRRLGKRVREGPQPLLSIKKRGRVKTNRPKGGGGCGGKFRETGRDTDSGQGAKKTLTHTLTQPSPPPKWLPPTPQVR